MGTIPEIQYEIVNLKDITLGRADPKKNARKITSVSVDGHKLIPTERFMTSFCAIYGVSPSIFNYFSPDEVIDRIVTTKQRGDDSADQRIRLAIEKADNREIALAVSRPSKPFLNKNDVEILMLDNGVDLDDVEYVNGAVTSWHRPRIGADADFAVMDDIFQNRFVVETPIDGYGVPAAYLSLLKKSDLDAMQTSRGVIGYSKVFRSIVSLGREQSDALNTMLRFLESFNNEEGFAALQQRMLAAANSPASLEEFFSIYNIIISDQMASLHKDAQGNFVKAFASTLVDRLKKLCGSLEVYGLVNYDSLSRKKRRTVPTAGRLYDLIKFVAETATRDANTAQVRVLHGWVGGILSNEFDLEGILETTGEDPESLFEGDLRTGGEKFALTGDRQLLSEEDLLSDNDFED